MSLLSLPLSGGSSSSQVIPTCCKHAPHYKPENVLESEVCDVCAGLLRDPQKREGWSFEKSVHSEEAQLLESGGREMVEVGGVGRQGRSGYLSLKDITTNKQR